MPPALTPALALDYVRELSADVRAGVVLDAAGELLAGPPQLAAPARALLDAGAGADEVESGNADGVVCAVRSGSHAAVAVCGRFAIPAIVREDLRTALAALEGRPPDSDAALVPLDARTRDAAASTALEPATRGPGQASPSTAHDALEAAAAALISAAERGFNA
jgi:hypothetical protein